MNITRGYFSGRNDFTLLINAAVYLILQRVIGDVRAESAWRLLFDMRITGYAKISKIRCSWSVASCNGSGY